MAPARLVGVNHVALEVGVEFLDMDDQFLALQEGRLARSTAAEGPARLTGAGPVDF
jgi:hypothetical protein